ncbi:MAG TPA: helix-turn-helix domain-containing protein [Pseudonocardiaceae bacterium]|nr:helix-turn-helix domain-containing protein [Pseudonocardiaceae bacterium]
MPQRQQDRSKATRAALIATARRLFAEHGYAGVPAEDIVAEAGLTRGALYHHFQDKRGLFEAVFVELESELDDEIRASMTKAGEPVVNALDHFLAACERPEVIQIGLIDAPAVLGWQTWRRIEEEHGLGLITDFLRAARARGELVTDAVEVLAKLMFSALIEAALVIANAQDRALARRQAQESLLALFAGLSNPEAHRSLLAAFQVEPEQGSQPP